MAGCVVQDRLHSQAIYPARLDCAPHDPSTASRRPAPIDSGSVRNSRRARGGPPHRSRASVVVISTLHPLLSPPTRPNVASAIALPSCPQIIRLGGGESSPAGAGLTATLPSRKAGGGRHRESLGPHDPGTRRRPISARTPHNRAANHSTRGADEYPSYFERANWYSCLFLILVDRTNPLFSPRRR